MPNAWRVIDLINWAESYFKGKGFENPRREIEWLLRDVLKCDRMDVYLRFEESLSKSQLDVIRSWVKRRIKHEPSQYITGSCEFYGQRLLVNKHVMIPRPETERLLDTVLEKVKEIVSPSILDVGTGSGCIALTLGLEKVVTCFSELLMNLSLMAALMGGIHMSHWTHSLIEVFC